MPKLKPKKGVVKRFKLTKKGKIKYKPCGHSHLLSVKSPAKLRKMRKAKKLGQSNMVQFVKKLLPYG